MSATGRLGMAGEDLSHGEGEINRWTRFELMTESVADGFYFAKLNVSIANEFIRDEKSIVGANSIDVLLNLLFKFDELFALRLAAINGSCLYHANHAEAVFMIPYQLKELLRVEFNVLTHDLELLFNERGPLVKFHLETADAQEFAFANDLKTRLFHSLRCFTTNVFADSGSPDEVTDNGVKLQSIQLIDHEIAFSTVNNCKD